MIVNEDGDRWRLITQPDHARFAGELLALWRGPELARHPRRDELLFAAREHDNGWRETDAAPRWDRRRGRPHDFRSLPEEEHREVWLRGTARYAGERPYAALLMVLHALALNDRRGAEGGDAESRDDFLDRLEERRGELLEASGVDAETASGDHRFLAWSDLASLAVCGGRDEPFAAEVTAPEGGTRSVRGHFDPATSTLHLDPLPLAGATTFRIPARWIPRRDLGGDAALGGELAAARWREISVRVAREAPSRGSC